MAFDLQYSEYDINVDTSPLNVSEGEDTQMLCDIFMYVAYRPQQCGRGVSREGVRSPSR